MSYQRIKFTEIADAIREKTRNTDAIKPSDFAKKIDDVYEAGKTAEYDEFWDAFQRKGTAVKYDYAFCGAGWTDDSYNPKYPIFPASCDSMFYGSEITDTKTEIDFTKFCGEKDRNAQRRVFYGCKYLKTIRKIKIDKNTVYKDWFFGAVSLENISIEGEIANDFDISWSEMLKYESLCNIISCLKDFSEDKEQKIHILCIGSENFFKLKLKDREAVKSKGWIVT